MSTCICGQSNFTEHQYIVCNNCQRCIHLECANLLWYQAKEIFVFNCQFCRPYTGPSVGKAVTNQHRNDRNEENSEMLPIQTGTPDFISYLKKNSALSDAKQGDIRKMRGQQLSLKELVISGFDKPILIETKDGLEVSTQANFTFDTLMQYYPIDYCIEVSEVTRQIKVKLKLTHLMAQFATYPADRQDVFQVRLDLSENSKLNETFIPPRIVRKLSWVDQYWPNVPFRPLLSKYCFITMENAYTDFHIDIGGASAWYHVIQGEQIFFLIEPTKHNLENFQGWIRSPSKETMLLTKAEKTYKTKVSTGETIFIPTGWIYAMLSTQDSITFGGFFLHSLSIATQLNINDFLHKLNAPELEFPSYELTNWYAAPNILKLARESFKNQPPKHLSEGIEALGEKLRFWLQKSKRDESSTIVPKAINCTKLVRDLSNCVRCTKSKSIGSKDKVAASIKAVKSKASNKDTATSSSSLTTIISQVDRDHHHHQQAMALDPEETRIKDLVKLNSSKGSSKAEEGSSALKLTFNMKLAQDVIRRSLDDPYDLNSEQNDQEFMLIDGKSKSRKKRKRKDEEEIAKMIEGRRQDENYIYLDIETPEENREAIKKSNDKMWEPGTSGGGGGGNRKAKPKVKKSLSINSSSSSQPSTSKTPSSSSKPVEKQLQQLQQADAKQQQQPPTESPSGEVLASDKTKKFKKGLATPKQRLAKKLWQRR